MFGAIYDHENYCMKFGFWEGLKKNLHLHLPFFKKKNSISNEDLSPEDDIICENQWKIFLMLSVHIFVIIINLNDDKYMHQNIPELLVFFLSEIF